MNLLPLLLADLCPGASQALAAAGLPVQWFAAAPRAGRFVLFDSRRGLPPCVGAGQDRIDVRAAEEARPGDSWDALCDEGHAVREFDLGGLAVRETTARVDKRAMRRRLLTALARIVERAGGIWIQLAAAPYPYRAAFNFRLDHDLFVPADFDATLSALSGHETSVTHYVCASTHLSAGESLARLRGMDVGSHGYYHHTYRDIDENRRNILRGIEWLDSVGISPQGFAAPHGRFPSHLDTLLDELGVSHSSEFALAFDDVPFSRADRRAIQIPIHPVCLGAALEAARDDCEPELAPHDVAELVSDWFLRVLDDRCRAHEPALFYGHPDGRIGRFPQVMRRVLEAAAARPDLWRTTHSQYAAWWRERGSVRLSVSVTAGQLRLFVEQPPRLPLAVEILRGDRVAVVPVHAGENVVRLDALEFQPRPTPQLPESRVVPRRDGLRGKLRRWLDWEQATPVEELQASSVRGWLKKTLRRARDERSARNDLLASLEDTTRSPTCPM